MPTTMCQKFVYSTSQEIILIFSENSNSHKNLISKADIWHHPIYTVAYSSRSIVKPRLCLQNCPLILHFGTLRGC